VSTWYSKELGVGAEAEAKACSIQSALAALIDAIKRPDGMGVFLQIEEDSEMNTVYFTPETGRLALAFGAEPCEKPVDDGYLSFIDGDRRLVRLHYGQLKGLSGSQ